MERAAESLLVPPSIVDELLTDYAVMFRITPRGVALTATGRTWVSEQLVAERVGVNAAAVESCYGQFLPLNERFKRLVSTWQVLSATGHSKADWSDLLASVISLHADFRPLVDATVGHLARLAPYGPRFDRALVNLQAGDASMLASPLKDSYHTVWFEFHEELIALSGRNRASEACSTG